MRSAPGCPSCPCSQTTPYPAPKAGRAALRNPRERLDAALAGRYAIERELGSGGMATVYVAEDLKYHRTVAVKVLRPELASVLGPDRFLREVEIAAKLNHPHILALYDSGEADGLLFYVMPYVKGESLRHKLERERQLPIDEALRITRQVASALGHAHDQGVIHRDVKPENILLYEGEAMVADFGIALAVSAAVGERLTETGLVVGTPEYMSPEQALGERELHARSDVYSLGCVLYEMLAGEPPFTGPTAQAVIAKRLADPVPAVRRLRDTVPAGVEPALIDADTDQHLWAETYDRQLTDVFAIQTDVALQIAAALQAELSPDERTRIHKEPTRDLQAYQLYLQGRHCLVKFTEPGIRRGIEYFEQAIAKDPEYALAHAGVAMAFTELGGQGGGAVTPAQAYERAKEAAAKALALDGALGEARCMLAFLKFVCDFDWTGAEAEFKRALDLSPGSADTYDLYGRMLSALMRHDEAIAMVKRAQELDPLAHRTDVASMLVRAGRYGEAVQAATRAVEFDRDDPRGRAILGWAHLKNGNPDTGLAQLERAVSLAPGNTLFWAQLGQAYALAGRVGQARDVLRQLQDLARERYVSPYHLAYIYTGLGEQDAAIDLLEQA